MALPICQGRLAPCEMTDSDQKRKIRCPLQRNVGRVELDTCGWTVGLRMPLSPYKPLIRVTYVDEHLGFSTLTSYRGASQASEDHRAIAVLPVHNRVCSSPLSNGTA
jgi:hypothetical protein